MLNSGAVPWWLVHYHSGNAAWLTRMSGCCSANTGLIGRNPGCDHHLLTQGSSSFPADSCRHPQAVQCHCRLAELTLEAGKWVCCCCRIEAYSAASQCYCPWAWHQPGPLENLVFQLHGRRWIREQPLLGQIHSYSADQDECTPTVG